MEKLTFGLGVAVLGLVVVFFGLLILIGFIKLLSWVNGLSEKKKAIPQAEAPAAELIPQPEPVVEEGIPGEVIAAISAAIAAVWDGEGGFVVRRVRRIQNAPAWNRVGRDEQMLNRF